MNYVKIIGEKKQKYYSINQILKIDKFQKKDVCNIDMLMEIYDRIYNNEWKVNPQTKPKLCTYVLFKDSCATKLLQIKTRQGFNCTIKNWHIIIACRDRLIQKCTL